MEVTAEEELSGREHEHNVRMTMRICNEIAALEKQIELRQTLLDGLKQELSSLYELLDIYAK